MEVRGHKQSTDLARKAASSASSIVAGKIVSALIQAAMFVVVARLLDPSGYGIYTILISIAAFVGAFGSLNIGVYLNERIPFFISKGKKGEMRVALGDSLIAMTAAGVGLFILGSALSPVIAHYALPSASYYLIILAMSSVVFSFLFNLLNFVLVGLNDGKNTGLALVLYSVFQAVFAVGLVYAGFGITGAMAGYIIGMLAATAFEFFVVMRGPGFEFAVKGMGSRVIRMLRFSMPLTYSNILSTLVSNFAVILLGLIVLPSYVGAYGVASRVGTVIDVLAGSVAIVLVPMFSEAIHNKGLSSRLGKFFDYSVYFGLLFTAPMIAYITVFANYFITTLFTPAYTAAVPYMQLTGIGLILGIFGTYAMQLVISTGKTSKIFRYSAIVAIVETVSMLVLAPIFHVFGVIISILYIGGMTTNLLFMNYIRQLGIETRMWRYIRVLGANLALGLLLFLFLQYFSSANREAMVAAGVVISIAAYPPILSIMRAASKEDALLLKKIGAGIPVFGVALKLLVSYALYFF